MKRILTDLYFEGVAKIRRALLGTETPLINSEIGYDNVDKRVRVHDGTSAKKLLQENDIDSNTALGVSDTVVPSQKAVKAYVDNNASSISETEIIAIQNEATTESTHYVSARRFWSGITRLLAIQNIWTALQTFNSITSKQIYTSKQTFVALGINPSEIINLDNGSYIVLDLTSASGTLTLTLTNGKIGGSYWIQVLQAATKVDVVLANEGRFDGETGSTIVGANSINYSIFPLCTGTGYILNIANQS